MTVDTVKEGGFVLFGFIDCLLFSVVVFSQLDPFFAIITRKMLCGMQMFY